MDLLRSRIAVATAFALMLLAGACSPSQPAPTAAPTSPVKSAATAPAATPTSAAAPSTSAPTKAASTPTASAPAASGVTIGDLNSKAKALTEYSFTSKITAAGQTVSSKGYVKGAKMRYEMAVAGASSVMLVDSAAKQAYTLIPAQKTAMKLDFSQALSQTEQPNAGVTGVANDTKAAGTETVDGKQAAIFEGKTDQGPVRYWIWVDRGLPLKAEVTSPQGKVTVEYTDYQFGPLDNGLFELPAGTQVIDVGGLIPGALPTLPTK